MALFAMIARPKLVGAIKVKPCSGLNAKIDLKGISKNALFPRLLRQLRARILMYFMYTPVLRAVLPCTHEKITIFRSTLN